MAGSSRHYPDRSSLKSPRRSAAVLREMGLFHHSTSPRWNRERGDQRWASSRYGSVPMEQKCFFCLVCRPSAPHSVQLHGHARHGEGRDPHVLESRRRLVVSPLLGSAAGNQIPYPSSLSLRTTLSLLTPQYLIVSSLTPHVTGPVQAEFRTIV